MPTATKLFPWRIFYRVAVVQSLLILLALGSAGLVARSLLKSQFLRLMEARVHDSLVVMGVDLAAAPNSEWCKKHSENTGWDLALHRADGTLVCDSLSLKSNGGTEAIDRPRLAGSETIGKPVFEADSNRLYGLMLAPHGMILRVSVLLRGVENTFRVFDTSMGIALAVVAVILGSLSFWLAQRLVFPLGRLILKTQRLVTHQPEVVSREDLTQEVFDEWADLESNIDRLKRDLVAKTQSLSMEQLELDTLMGAISDAILAVDPEGSPLFYNSRFEVLFGSEDLRRKNLKLWGIFREPDILRTFESALKEGRSGATKAIALEQKLGARRFFTLSVSPLRRQDGKVYGALGIFHDVTELKAAEQMRIDFVANVSHELRTPLTVIKGYADTLLLDFGKTSDGSLDYLNSIARNSDRLMSLMNDLLDLSSLESDSIIQKDPLNTLDLTERIVKQLQGAFDAKKQTLTTDYTAQTVFADAERLEQVLVNLLSNANKYTPAGGGVRVEWYSDGSDTILKVQDTGPGIPIEHHARLFERFYRVDKARSREQGGTGLGLAIVKHIMQRHEGAIWVESASGKGSTFFCRFPGVDSLSDVHRS
jgi:two-component system, OmpR family, phosphate regulon sensor histidine kinase PhoR